jgi:hypothetical protein
MRLPSTGVKAISDGERGQVLIIFMAMISIIFMVAAVSIDHGLWLAERRSVVRASDLAALAGARDLPASPSTSTFDFASDCDVLPLAGDACRAGFHWAQLNGYAPGQNDALVTIHFFCGNHLPWTVIDSINNQQAGDTDSICKNENCPASGVGPCDAQFPFSPCPTTPHAVGTAGEGGCDVINVDIGTPGVSLLSNYFGGVNFDVTSGSYGGVTFKLIPTDSVIAIDASGSMGGSLGNCNSTETNVGCKIREARIAANNFVDVLVNGSPITKVGYTPYRDCYDPPLIGGSNCIGSMTPLTFVNCDTPPASSQISCLNTASATAHGKINATKPGGSTNICYGLFESKVILDGPGNQALQSSPFFDEKTKRFAVILTDGDNSYNSSHFNAGQNSPPTECRPSNPSQDLAGGNCSSSQGTNERDLDVKTKQFTDAMKAANIEIYVVGLNVCGTNSPSQFATASYCSGIGNTNGDATADRRLLKCIASSTDGTNDHYFETNNATALGDIFQHVAYEIASRGFAIGAP